MKLHILSIILWPSNSEMARRQIDLSTKRINVLTGKSQTGKSALLAIVDYCLGSKKCTIPVGLIRETTEWFGLHIQLEETELVIGRAEPGDRQQSTDAFLWEARGFHDYPRPRKNCSVDAIKSRLAREARLSDLDFEGGVEMPGFHGRASFRDMAAFNFLPQHIIANPHTLFFKADTHEHREKLRTVFPLALGAIDSTTLQRRYELRDLEKELKELRYELEARKKSLQGWMDDLSTSYLRAIELGLLEGAPQPSEDWKAERYISFLRRAIESSKERLPRVTTGSTDRIVKKLQALSDEEEQIAREIGFRRHKLRQLSQLRSSSHSYNRALSVQEDRLTGVGWFVSRLKEQESQCPLCGSNLMAHRKHLAQLMSASSELERSTAALADSTAIIDKELMSIRRELRELEGELNSLRQKRSEQEALDERIREQRQTLQEVYRFAGQVEEAIKNIDAIRGDGQLLERQDNLMQKIEELNRLIDPPGLRRKREAALERVSRNMTPHLEALGVEDADAPVKLDLQNLTLRITGDQGRDDFLWEIGSAANWMGYHIATFLALHEHFLQQEHSPVPRFLILDQPSQAFFPERWPLDRPSVGPDSVELKSDDIQRVHQIFKTLVSAFEAFDHKLQIFVVDHADEVTWEGLTVNLVDRWRGDDALIPIEWLEGRSQSDKD